MGKTTSATARPRWLFDEFRDFGWSDAHEIEAYDRLANVNPVLERLLSLGVSENHTLIDFGCGTGVLALEAGKLCRKVVAVDVSAAMLAYTKRKAEHLAFTILTLCSRAF